jgi:cyclic pyranopterin phosphate synthase
VRNVNLSLDTLVASKFPFLARRNEAYHHRIMETIMKVASQEEHFNLKLNCVLLRGVNEEEVGSFIDLTEHLPIEVRFLEFMPFDGNSWSAGRMVPQADIVASIQQHMEKRGLAPADRLPPDSLNDVARLWRVPGWRGRLGVIASMTNAFCSGCNRLRLTSSGELRNCLFGEEGWSMRDALRAGASDEELAPTVATGVRSKFRHLGGKRDMHELRERGAFALPMVALGG